MPKAYLLTEFLPLCWFYNKPIRQQLYSLVEGKTLLYPEPEYANIHYSENRGITHRIFVRTAEHTEAFGLSNFYAKVIENAPPLQMISNVPVNVLSNRDTVVALSNLLNHTWMGPHDDSTRWQVEQTSMLGQFMTELHREGREHGR